MNNKIILLAIYLISTSSSHAGEERVINGIAPVGVERLETTMQSHTEAPLNKGPHGSKEYCYKTNIYVVYGSNLLGQGYKLSQKPPENLKCIKTNKNISGKNKLGMHIGILKSETERLLKVKNIKDKDTIIWQKELIKNGIRFDLQTYVELLFVENKLVWLSVFTAQTT